MRSRWNPDNGRPIFARYHLAGSVRRTLGRRHRLTPVVWFLAMGCILVNLSVLPQQPGIFVRDLAEIGIIVIMFAMGFDENSDAFLRSIRFSWIGPVFFIVLGTHLALNTDILLSVIDETLALFIGLFAGQVLSAGLAARFTGRFDWYDSWSIGFGMLGRAELAFVVMDIACVEHHVINEEMFYTVMAAAFSLNLSVTQTGAVASVRPQLRCINIL